MKWKNADTEKPKDGQWVIARTNQRAPFCEDDESGWHICQWLSEEDFFQREDLKYVDATHWHPLPHPPKIEG